MGAFQAIRKHHKSAEITLMTTAFFKKMAEDCGYFDKVFIDPRKPFYNIKALLSLRRFFRDGQFNRIYDLQCVSRTNLYYKYLLPRPRPHWSGLADGCSLPHTDISRKSLHTYDRHREQLKQAGLRNIPDPDLDWITIDVTHFNLPEPYALLIPGAAPGGEQKQWPTEYYGKLAVALNNHGLTPVVIGTKLESSKATAICSLCPEAVDLTGQTGLYDLVGLARKAAYAVGNDTGPTHMIAQAHCPISVLFSNHSDPKLFGPRGKNVTILQSDDLHDLSPGDVLEGVKLRLSASDLPTFQKKVSP